MTQYGCVSMLGCDLDLAPCASNWGRSFYAKSMFKINIQCANTMQCQYIGRVLNMKLNQRLIH